MSANALPKGRRYYRTSDLHRITGVSIRTVERWAADGTLPALQVRGTWLFPINMIEQQLDGLLREGRKRSKHGI